MRVQYDGDNSQPPRFHDGGRQPPFWNFLRAADGCSWSPRSERPHCAPDPVPRAGHEVVVCSTVFVPAFVASHRSSLRCIAAQPILLSEDILVCTAATTKFCFGKSVGANDAGDRFVQAQKRSNSRKLQVCVQFCPLEP